MGRIIFLQLAATYLLTSTIPAVTALSITEDAAQALGLLPRASTCSLAGFTPCNQDGLPENFCCPSATTCVPFNNRKSAICCPNGQSCSVITAISCDITQQNATLHPESQLFSTDLTGTLATCNGNCCPKGYSCQNGQCAVGTSSSPTSTSSTATTSLSSTSTQKPTSSSSSLSAKPSSSSASTSSSASASASHSAIPSSAVKTNSPAPQAHCPQFTPSGILVGFFSGLATGILLTIAFLCCFGHRRHQEPSSPHSSDFSNVGASISDPIYKSDGMDAVRADFLRRKTSKPRPSMRSMFSRSSQLGARNAPVDGIGRSIQRPPQTPTNQRSQSPQKERESSGEMIQVWSPPEGNLVRPGTQFGDMLKEVGWDTTQPYLGSPGRVDPRSRPLGGQ